MNLNEDEFMVEIWGVEDKIQTLLKNWKVEFLEAVFLGFFMG